MSTHYDIEESFTFNVERDVLYDDGGGYDLVIPTGCPWGHWGCMHVAQGRRAPGRRQVGVVGRRQGATVGKAGRVVEPLLDVALSTWLLRHRLIEGRTYRWEGGTRGLVLERRLIHTEGVVLRLCGDRRGCSIRVWVSAITGGVAFKVVSVVKTLLGGLRGQG